MRIHALLCTATLMQPTFVLRGSEPRGESHGNHLNKDGSWLLTSTHVARGEGWHQAC